MQAGNGQQAQRFFEDVSVGEVFARSLRPTREAVLAFLDLPGMADEDPRLVDREAARAAGYEGPLVPGQMSTLLLMRLVTDWIGPMGRVRTLEVLYRRAVLHDDVVRCVGQVTDVTEQGDYEDSGQGEVHLDVAVENERGEKPVQGIAIAVLPRRG